MLLVGLTGGIGTGKSTVAARLAERGAVVVDADVLGREAVAPGTAGFENVVKRFGKRLVDPSTGGLDRNALAATVFADEMARRDLEAIIHPEVGRRLAETVGRYRDSDAILVFDAPLIVEGGFADMVDVLVVVTSKAEEQVRRLMELRGMAEDDVRARIGAQAPTEEKVARADVVIENDGSEADLAERVDAL
ncbi:MAG TPA: dephospho-CoA kinase, partial [Actinomycetota bacterium]|nr:dephospho-CoA kinase [Actinomycetota bacterium]